MLVATTILIKSSTMNRQGTVVRLTPVVASVYSKLAPARPLKRHVVATLPVRSVGFKQIRRVDALGRKSGNTRKLMGGGSPLDAFDLYYEENVSSKFKKVLRGYSSRLAAEQHQSRQAISLLLTLLATGKLKLRPYTS